MSSFTRLLSLLSNEYQGSKDTQKLTPHHHVVPSKDPWTFTSMLRNLVIRMLVCRGTCPCRHKPYILELVESVTILMQPWRQLILPAYSTLLSGVAPTAGTWLVTCVLFHLSFLILNYLAKYCRITERLNGCLLQGQDRKTAFTATARSEPTHVEQSVASDQRMTGLQWGKCGIIDVKLNDTWPSSVWGLRSMYTQLWKWSLLVSFLQENDALYILKAMQNGSNWNHYDSPWL